MRFLQFAREWPNPLSLVPEFKKTLLQRRNWQITRSLSRHVTLNPERTKVCPPCLVSEWVMGPDAREYSWYLIAPLISQFGFGFAHIPLFFFFRCGELFNHKDLCQIGCRCDRLWILCVHPSFISAPDAMRNAVPLPSAPTNPSLVLPATNGCGVFWKSCLSFTAFEFYIVFRYCKICCVSVARNEQKTSAFCRKQNLHSTTKRNNKHQCFRAFKFLSMKFMIFHHSCLRDNNFTNLLILILFWNLNIPFFSFKVECNFFGVWPDLFSFGCYIRIWPWGTLIVKWNF